MSAGDPQIWQSCLMRMLDERCRVAVCESALTAAAAPQVGPTLDDQAGIGIVEAGQDFRVPTDASASASNRECSRLEPPRTAG